jgi:hypothetical protein
MARTRRSGIDRLCQKECWTASRPETAYGGGKCRRFLPGESVCDWLGGGEGDTRPSASEEIARVPVVLRVF